MSRSFCLPVPRMNSVSSFVPSRRRKEGVGAKIEHVLNRVREGAEDRCLTVNRCFRDDHATHERRHPGDPVNVLKSSTSRTLVISKAKTSPPSRKIR